MRKLIDPMPSRHQPIPSYLRPKRLIELGIHCQYFMTDFHLFDIPPWGTILPAIGAKGHPIRYSFEVETLHLPENTVLGIRWTPASGNHVHTVSQTLTGDGQINTRLPIPNDWVLEAEGEDVLIECEVSYPDGKVEKGRTLEIHVLRDVVIGDFALADLHAGDTLDPAKYPDGILARIDPIGNVEEYQTVNVTWLVMGYLGTGSIQVYRWYREQPAEPGKTYEFLIPPEAYSGYSEMGFDRVEVRLFVDIKVVPPIAPEFFVVIDGFGLSLLDAQGK